jgi:hypothetical protein
MKHPTVPTPGNTPNNPPQVGVAAASTTSDGYGSRLPYPCAAVFRDALKDLVSHDGMTSINPENKKCPWGIALQKNGLAAWTASPAPGKWTITPSGWAFLETRIIEPKETR